MEDQTSSTRSPGEVSPFFQDGRRETHIHRRMAEKCRKNVRDFATEMYRRGGLRMVVAVAYKDTKGVTSVET